MYQKPTEPDSDDDATRFAKQSRAHTRRNLLLVALVFFAAGGIVMILITQLTDIGHAAGFAGMGLALWLAASVFIWEAIQSE